MHQVQDEEVDNFLMEDIEGDNQIIIMDAYAGENALVLIRVQYGNEEGEGEIEEVGDTDEAAINGLDLIGIHYPNDEEEGEVEEVEGDVNVEDLGEEEVIAEDDDFEEPIDVAAEGEEAEEEEQEEGEGENVTLEFEAPFRFKGGEGDVPQIVLVVPNANNRDDGESEEVDDKEDKEDKEEKSTMAFLAAFYASDEEDEDEPMEVSSPEREGEKEMAIDMQVKVAKRSSSSSM